jgi:AraC-like DNA-binding protein
MRLIPDNFRNVYFRRLFLSYSVVVIVISCLSGAFIYDKARRVGSDEMRRESRDRLNELKTYIESAYMDRFKSAFIKDMLSSPDSAGSMRHIFYDQYDPNIYQIFRVVNHLKAMVAANPGTESVSLYFANMKFIVDPYTFFKITDTYPDHELIRSIESDPGLLNRWLVRTKSYGGGVTDSLLTYVYTFPNQHDLYMLIDLPVGGMRELLDSQLRSPEEKLIMFDPTYTFVIGSSNVSERELADYAGRLGQRSGGGMNANGASISFVQDAGQPDGWIYASARPPSSLSSPVGALQRQILLVLAGVLMAGLTASYYLTVYTYRPLRYMLHKLKHVQTGIMPVQLRNEFHVIEDIVTGVLHKVNQMKGQLDEKKLLALLHGRLDAGEMPEQLPPDSRFTVVNVRTNEGMAKELLAAFRQLPSSVPYAVVEKHAGEFSLLFYSAEPDGGAGRIRAELERFRIADRERADRFVAGIGSMAETTEDIPKSHEHAAWALRYSFVMERNPIIEYEAVKDRDELPSIHYEPFENALRSGDCDAVLQFIDEFEAVLRREHIALEAVELALLQPMMILSKVMVDMNAREKIFPFTLLFRDFRQSTCRETVVRIREQSVQVARHIQHYLQSRVQHDLIRQIKHYIDTHLHETISLDTLSEMAGLSTPYLSKQFKDILHVSFIDYLTNARMERARELLHTSDLSVTAISAQVGYSNLQYFSSRFKTKFGVTPSQYRSASNRKHFLSADAGE